MFFKKITFEKTSQVCKRELFEDFTDAGDMWNFPYESAVFPLEVEDVWQEVNPVFEQLHAYVRRKLRDLYGPERVSKTAPLPSHILGN